MLSLGTLKSSPDERGNHHRLSIDALSSKCCQNVTTYKAQIYSFSKDCDPRDRSLVTVKFPASKHTDSDQWAECELRKSKLARRLAMKYNEYVRQALRVSSGSQSLEGTRLSFLQLQTATLTSTSFAHKKRRKGECLVFEDTLENFTHFTDTVGRARDGAQQGKRARSRSSSTSTSQRLPARSRSIPIPGASDNQRQSRGGDSVESRALCSSVESESPPPYEESQLNELERLLESFLYVNDHIQDSVDPSRIVTLVESLVGCNLNSRTAPDFDETDDTAAVECDDEDVTDPFIQSFVHFFFCHTSGQAIVCGLKGNHYDGRYTFVTPVVHSLGQHFGDRDGGELAIRKVLANHRCSRLCRHLPDVFTVLREADRRHNNLDWDYV